MTGGSTEWVLKGQNLLIKMCSALEAEIPVSKSNAFDEELQMSLLASDQLLVCGEATSHHVNCALRDIASRWPKEETSKICLLMDCASAVLGFGAAADAFQKDMEEVGVAPHAASQVFSDWHLHAACTCSQIATLGRANVSSVALHNSNPLVKQMQAAQHCTTVIKRTRWSIAAAPGHLLSLTPVIVPGNSRISAPDVAHLLTSRHFLASEGDCFL